mmetsp:Transcript_3442/g.7948  ORF Transcript_3442/g.7948 Transcript_3442/m.7948 type:complete len:370 (-) Transcript_3442:242-1351(-)
MKDARAPAQPSSEPPVAANAPLPPARRMRRAAGHPSRLGLGAVNTEPPLEPGTLVLETALEGPGRLGLVLTSDHTIGRLEVLLGLSPADNLLLATVGRDEEDLVGYLEGAHAQLPVYGRRLLNLCQSHLLHRLDVDDLAGAAQWACRRSEHAAYGLGHNLRLDVLEESRLILLAEDQELLPRALRDEDGERLEELRERRGEVDKNRLALGLWVVLTEHLGDRGHAPLHLGGLKDERHPRVVVNLAEVLHVAALKGQELYGPLHQLRAVPDKGLHVAEDLLQVHAPEAADHDGPAIHILAADDVVALEVVRKLCFGQLVNAAISTEDQRRDQTLNSLVDVELLSADVLEKYDVGGVALLLQILAPDRLLR